MVDARLSGLQRAFHELVVGHEEAKRRLLEMAAIRLRFGAAPGPVPTLCGPGGSGRTALAEALAAGLSLPLIRVSLTGLSARDLRGRARHDGGEHGVIRSRLGTRPEAVVLLEGLDRLGLSRSDASARDRAALCLRSLFDRHEPFIDRFEGEEIALDRAFVIATADHFEGLPDVVGHLLQPIALRGYDRDEKVLIARRHLVPKALAELGVPAGRVELTPAALERLVAAYAPEAGVRGLYDRITELLRRAAASVALGEVASVRIEPGDVEKGLGPPPGGGIALRAARAQVGVTLGLLCTHQGGDVALVEALLGEAGGPLEPRLTGVRGEAIESALAYLRQSAEALSIDRESMALDRVAVRATTPPRPVDTARSGLDLPVLVALTSVATDRPVRPDVALVGAVTLLGAVKPLPGLPEMVLGAARRGVRRVLLPKEGLPEVRRALPASTLASVELEPIEHASEAAKAALIDIVIAREIR